MTLQITVTRDRRLLEPSISFQIALDETATDEQITEFLERVGHLFSTNLIEKKAEFNQQINDLLSEENKYRKQVEALSKLLTQLKQLVLNLRVDEETLNEILRYPEFFEPDLLSSRVFNGDDDEEDDDNDDDKF